MVRDEVQYVRNHRYPDGSKGWSYQAHTPIKSPQGLHYLAVQVSKKQGLPEIRKTRMNSNRDWYKKHQKTVRHFYSQAKRFREVFPELEMIFGKDYDNLAELNLATIYWGMLHLLEEEVTINSLNLDFVNEVIDRQSEFRLKKIYLGSESKYYKAGKKLGPGEKIVSLCKQMGADEDYCGGTAVAAYMDEELFERNKIKVVVQDWKCPEYEQLFVRRAGFVANLSLIDLVMNVDLAEARKIIKGE